MRIVVLVKHVPDTWSERTLDLATGRIDRASVEQVMDEISERAVEAAVGAVEANSQGEVIAVSMGPVGARGSLKKALSMGASSAVHIRDDNLVGSDLLRTARVLAAVISALDAALVIAGDESTDGRSGMVPAALAEILGLPFLSRLDTAEIADGAVAGTRVDSRGVAHMSVQLPAVISITESMPEARFPNFRGIMAAKKKPLEEKSLGDIHIGSAAKGTVVISVDQRPARKAGVIVVDDGTAADTLIQYLLDEKMIERV
jgi:electron transfer flavoprotein beta subunit